MPIQCRTGCQEQVNYEHFHFPDGFTYFLPKNLDDSIHDCKNLQTPGRLHYVKYLENGKVIKEEEMTIPVWSPDEAHFHDILENRNMKELTGLSGQFGKIAKEAKSLQERMGALYEDMGNILGRYYEIGEVVKEETKT